uniref:Putative GT2 n=1 Tax=Magnetococcus massalia (strain MO-1) TaxID=451514 RepID=A0A1S7LH46_MAGMO|nr:Putative GT2 [Candidatus Magnetococcus massalia]
MPQPEVSVLLPFYNAATTLEETLHSILQQSLPHFELVAVDDGSSDHSAEIIKKLDDPRIRLIELPENRGVAAASNAGIEQARSDLIARMDADDRMAPTRLEKQVAFMRHNPQCAVVASQVSLFPKERITDGFQRYIDWQNSCLTAQQIADEIYWEAPLANPSTLFRKEIVMPLGGFLDGPFPEDYELWLRLHAHGHTMVKLPEVLLEWRDHEQRLTRTHSRYTREAFDQVRADYLARDARLHQGRPLAIWGTGRPTRRRVDRLLAHGHHPALWVEINPRKIGNQWLGAPIIAPAQLAEQQPKPFVLSYVTAHGAREEITAQLRQMGFQAGEDYLMVG